MTSFYWALFTALTWGMVPILEKIGLARTIPLTGLYLRCLGVLSGLIIFTIFRLDIAKQAFNTNPKSIIFIMTGGLLASVIGQLFFYNALKSGEASRVVPVAAMYPLVSFILGVLFLKEAITVSKIAGLSFVLLGIALLK